jgi:preprotein translocase subunit SecF
MGKKKIAAIIVLLVISIGVFTTIQISRDKANLGIDFAGGTGVQIKFQNTHSLHDIKKALYDAQIKDFDLQDVADGKKILVRIKKTVETVGVTTDNIVNALIKGFPNDKLVVDYTTEIGPKVGKKLRNDAMNAVMWSIVCILIYITLRFRKSRDESVSMGVGVSFGIGAIVATFHDVMAILAFFYVFNMEININMLSALLMIAGYSLTDTVVVFDRIRENFKTVINDQMINASINQVLSRTIITSLTTFISAAALFVASFFGGEVIRDFALAIMIGIITGTLSSIFIASPVVLWLWHPMDRLFRQLQKKLG